MGAAALKTKGIKTCLKSFKTYLVVGLLRRLGNLVGNEVAFQILDVVSSDNDGVDFVVEWMGQVFAD